MEDGLRTEAFQVLRQALKARGMTYADLAERLDVSEPTIKRLFAERDCKVSRLLSVCEILGVPINDVLETAQRQEDTPSYLTSDVEEAMAEMPSLVYFFILLRDEIPLSEIARCYKLDAADLFLYGRDLERLGLAEIMPDGNIRLLSKQPISFRTTGPLYKIVNKLNLDFLARVLEESYAGSGQTLRITRRMRPESAEIVRSEMGEFSKRIAYLARQDQMLFPDADLETFKLTSAWARIDFPAMFTVESHPRKETL